MRTAEAVEQAVWVMDGRALCPCGEQIDLPEDGPVLTAHGRRWDPTLVAVRCPACRSEVRLQAYVTTREGKST
jgi:hypothetical protein